MGSKHIVIIGAGLIGLATADSLEALGAKVTIIDRLPGPGMGCSFSNSGMLHISQSRAWVDIPSWDPDAAIKALDVARDVCELATESVNRTLKNLHRLGLGAFTHTRGCFQIFDTLEAMALAQDNYALLGVQANVATGATQPLGQYALHLPDDAFSNAYIYCRALARELKSRGVEYIFEADGVQLTESGGAITGVEFQSQKIEADGVVLACGAGSTALAATVGQVIPVVAVRGFALNYARPHRDVQMPRIPVMDAKSRSAFTPFEDHVRLSGTLNADSSDVLKGVWTDISEEFMAALGPVEREWSGERPVSADGRPYIGRCGVPGLWVNTGHGHMGWTLATASGQLLADMIIEGRVDTRFRLPKPVMRMPPPAV